MNKRKILRYLILLAVFVLVDVLFSVIYFHFSYHIVSKLPGGKADAAIVFFSGFTKNTFQLDHETVRRLDKTLLKARNKQFTYIICAGGNRPASNIYGSDTMKKYLLGHNIPGDIIFTEKVSFNTFTNLAAALQIAKHKQWDTIMLISSNIHLLRINSILPSDSQLHFVYPDTRDDLSGLSDYLYYWKCVNREWISRAVAYFLPRDKYISIVRKLRN